MGIKGRHRRMMTKYAVEALREAGILGEVLDHEPTDKAGRKIQALIMDVANDTRATQKGAPDE